MKEDWWRTTPVATKAWHYSAGGADTRARPAPSTGEDEGCRVSLHQVRTSSRHDTFHKVRARVELSFQCFISLWTLLARTCLSWTVDPTSPSRPTSATRHTPTRNSRPEFPTTYPTSDPLSLVPLPPQFPDDALSTHRNRPRPRMESSLWCKFLCTKSLNCPGITPLPNPFFFFFHWTLGLLRHPPLSCSDSPSVAIPTPATPTSPLSLPPPPPLQ